MDAFAQRKASTLAELALDAGDLSRAGHVDARARAVVALVNTHPAFFTTSSCAGRVSLFADPTAETRAAGMKGGEWVYVSHDPADAAAVVSAVRRKLGEGTDAASSSSTPDPETSLVLRFEPFILAVEAESVEAGSRFARLARDAGFRESGVVAGGTGRAVCSARCSIRMEAPLVAKGTRLVSDEAIKVLVAIANEKWAANAARAERLRERIAAAFAAERAEKSDAEKSDAEKSAETYETTGATTPGRPGPGDGGGHSPRTGAVLARRRRGGGGDLRQPVLRARRRAGRREGERRAA